MDRRPLKGDAFAEGTPDRVIRNKSTFRNSWGVHARSLKVGRSSSGEPANSTDSKYQAPRKSSQPVDAGAITLVEPDAGCAAQKSLQEESHAGLPFCPNR